MSSEPRHNTEPANDRVTVAAGRSTKGQSLKGRTTAVVCVAFALGMLGMSYAAVPLYQLFCQVTGYGGTTQAAEAAPDRVLERTVTVRFDANTARGLGWAFRPVERTINVRVGETKLAFYEAENTGDRAVTGTATFNVTPQKVGAYFSKIDCFCFQEQTLAPGERVDMPVTFFIDPAIADEPLLDDITQITLSYTFFPVEDAAEEGTGARADAGEAAGGRGQTVN